MADRNEKGHFAKGNKVAVGRQAAYAPYVKEIKRRYVEWMKQCGMSEEASELLSQAYMHYLRSGAAGNRADMQMAIKILEVQADRGIGKCVDEGYDDIKERIEYLMEAVQQQYGLAC